MAIDPNRLNAWVMTKVAVEDEAVGPVIADVSVAHGRADVLVPEELLDFPQILRCLRAIGLNGLFGLPSFAQKLTEKRSLL